MPSTDNNELEGSGAQRKWKKIGTLTRNHNSNSHVKAKRPNGHEMLSIFPFPAGMSLTKLYLNDSLADFFLPCTYQGKRKVRGVCNTFCLSFPPSMLKKSTFNIFRRFLPVPLISLCSTCQREKV